MRGFFEFSLENSYLRLLRSRMIAAAPARSATAAIAGPALISGTFGAVSAVPAIAGAESKAIDAVNSNCFMVVCLPRFICVLMFRE